MLFIEQMEWLKFNARVATLNEIVTALTQRRPFHERTVVLTFDDGFEDFYSVAAPVLRCHGFPACVFLPTAYCGKTNAWAGQPDWVEKRPLLDWDRIAELAQQGFEFGAHSRTHPDLTRLPETEAEREIRECRKEIETRISQPVEFFCYPYGRWHHPVREIVQRYYLGACSTAAGALQGMADPYALPRVDAHYVRNPSLFRNLFTGGFLMYLMARRLVRRLRGQAEGFYVRR